MVTQLTLNFESQSDHLKRVKSKTAGAILAFFAARRVGDTFHAQELRDFVAARVPVAPASPDRILRAMRRDGLIGYVVINRRDSLYRVE